MDISEPTTQSGYRDVMINFPSGESRVYRVYESMYDRAKDLFYGSSSFDFIVGYEMMQGTPDTHKSYINLKNVCYLRVLKKCNGHRVTVNAEYTDG